MNTSTEPVKKSNGRADMKDMIAIRAYHLTAGVPSKLKFSDSPIRFMGFDPERRGKNLIWGIQGTSSTNSADAFASRDARSRGWKVYQMELHYHLDSMPESGKSITKEIAETTGYAHFSRITSEYRDELRATMLGWLTSDKDPGIDHLADYSFEDLIVARPMLVHRLLDTKRALNVVIHPIHLPGGVTLRIATVRKKTANIVRVFTRGYDQIATSV